MILPSILGFSGTQPYMMKSSENNQDVYNHDGSHKALLGGT